MAGGVLMGNGLPASCDRAFFQPKARRWKASTFAPLIILIATPFAAAQSRASEYSSHPVGTHQETGTQTQQSEPTQSGGYHSFGVAPVLWSCGSPGSGGGASEARAHLLDKEGPQLPAVFSM